MVYYDNSECQTEAGGTSCTDFDYNQCCNAGTDDEGDPIGTWSSSDSFPNSGGPEDYVYTVFTGSDLDACDEVLGQFGPLPDCAKFTGIQGGLVTARNGRRAAAFKRLANANNSVAKGRSSRHWIWRIPQSDGTFKVYMIEFGTPQALEYKRQTDSEAKKAYMLANWRSIIVLDQDQARKIREITR